MTKTSKYSGFFTIRMDDGRREKLFKFKKLYAEVSGRPIGTQAGAYDVALDIAINRLEQILEDKGKLGIR